MNQITKQQKKDLHAWIGENEARADDQYLLDEYADAMIEGLDYNIAACELARDINLPIRELPHFLRAAVECGMYEAVWGDYCRSRYCFASALPGDYEAQTSLGHPALAPLSKKALGEALDNYGVPYSFCGSTILTYHPSASSVQLILRLDQPADWPAS